MSTDQGRVARVLGDLGASVLERGWLSSNNVVFHRPGGGPLTIVDTSYASHGAQTLDLLASRFGGAPVERVVNTHLHSDHCGGNAALHRVFGCDIWVPASSFDAVNEWDRERLTFELTDQRCERFVASRGVESKEDVRLGGYRWLALPVDGHDPDALVFFQPESRVLISADALWEDRLAIIFPAIDGGDGFAAARRTFDLIESLEARVVIPGHGRPFGDVAAALSSSRRRLDRFEADPAAHLRHAARALCMFHLLEHRCREARDLELWLVRTPIFARIALALAVPTDELAGFAENLVAGLVRDKLLQPDAAGLVCVAAS